MNPQNPETPQPPVEGSEPIQPFQPTQPAEPTQAPQPFAPQTPVMPAAPKSSSKKLIVIIAAIVALLVIGGIVLAVLLMPGKDGTSPIKDAVNTVTTGSSEVANRSDGTLDLSQTIDNIDGVKSQDVSAKLGQQVNLSNGVSLMVSKISTLDSYQRTFGGEVSTVQPESGNEFVELTFVIGNRVKGDSLSYSSSTFDLVGATGGKEYRSETFLSSDPLKPADYYSLDLKKLDAGQQQSFILYYEVPKASALTVEYSKKFKNYATDEVATVGAKITVR